MQKHGQHKSIPWQWLAVGAAVVGVTVSWFFLPVGEWVQFLTTWIAQRGVWGAVLFTGVYVFGTIILVPGAPLSLAAGVIFGIGWGILLVLVSATIGATCAFLVARYLAREKVAALAHRHPQFKAVDQAISAEGWKVVVLLRLSPLIPFNLQNYFYGITAIQLWHYVPATLIGILPGTCLYMVLGAAGKAALGTGHTAGGVLEWSLVAVGLVATVLVTVLITQKARATLAEIHREAEP